MPIKRCGNNGWQYGDSGQCYTGPDAKKKAIKQGIAIDGPKKFSEKAYTEGAELYEKDIEWAASCMYEERTHPLSDLVSAVATLESVNGWTEELTEDNFYVPASEDYYDGYDEDEDVVEWDIATEEASLWENIRRKRMRGEPPAKKGDKDRPDPEAFKRAQSKELQKDVYDNPGEAMKRAEQLGLDGIHDHPSKKDPSKKVFMPGKNHDEYEKKLREEMSKAIVKSYADHAEALQRGKPGPNDPRKTPAPKKDQKKGSKKNKPDSAKDDKGKITFSKETISKLSNAVREHNAKGKGSKATLGQLKAVYRRGAGAFSTSHAPKMSRDGWAMARVRAFLHLLRTGRPSNPNYKQDNDLLPSSHPRSTKAYWQGADYIYEDTKTGEKHRFNHRGDHRKDGRPLLYKGVAAEYKGRKVTLNKPFRTPSGPKKSAVYVKKPNGKVVIVRFGDPNMKIKKNIPGRRKNFRARHNCSNPGPKYKPRYWSCRAW